MKAIEAHRAITKDGWYEVPSKGGHRQYKHPTKPGRATIPFHGGDLSLDVVRSLERQTGVKLRNR